MRYILIILLFNATFLKGQNSEIFGHLREGVSLTQYLHGCNTKKIDSTMLNAFLLDLNEVELKHSSDNMVRIANDSLQFKKSSEIHLFKSADNKSSLYIEEFQNKAELNDRWRVIQQKQRVYWGYSRYYFKFDSLQKVSLNATFSTKNNIINIQKTLPFYATSYDSISKNQWNLIDDANTYFIKTLKFISDHLTSDNDKQYFPANGRLYQRIFTPTERLAGFVNFWTEVKYNFAFFDQVPNLDWDQVLVEYLPLMHADQSNYDYYKLLIKVCAKLNDGHTNIYLPFDLMSRKKYYNVKLSNFDDGIYIVNTSEKYKDILPLGSKIIKVNGIKIDDYLQEKLFPFISASTMHIKKKIAIKDLFKISNDAKIDIDFISPSGNQGTYEFSNLKEDTTAWINDADDWNRIEFEMLQSNVAYLKINTFNSKEVVEEFKKLTDSIRSAKKLIIDLRMNGGGNSSYAYDILKYFADKPFLTSKWMTREHKSAYKAWGNYVMVPPLNQWDEECLSTYRGDYWYVSPPDTIEPNNNNHISIPIIVLIGNNTASSAEDFLVSAENIGITETIGDYTYGSTGQPLPIRLPGDGSGRICTKKDTYPDGKEFVGYGIKPKYIVKPTVNDVLKGRDVVLEYALKLKL